MMTETPKRKIMIVDDEDTVCRSIKKALARDEYDIDVALSGEDALKMEKQKSYDVIIVDLMMPGINGMELLKSLKSVSPAVQVVMITGYPTMKNTLQAMQIGAFDFLPKPFLPHDLRNLVARALDARDKAIGGSGTPG
jgi:DNA-binding NtrC family response regulator